MIKSTLKIARYCPFVIQRFLQFFRVVSSDYGKPRIHYKVHDNNSLVDHTVSSLCLVLVPVHSGLFFGGFPIVAMVAKDCLLEC